MAQPTPLTKMEKELIDEYSKKVMINIILIFGFKLLVFALLRRLAKRATAN